MHIHSMYIHRETYQSNVWEYYVCKNVSFFQNYHPSSNSIFRITFDSIYLQFTTIDFFVGSVKFPSNINNWTHLIPFATDYGHPVKA